MPLVKICAHYGCLVILPPGNRFCDYHKMKAVQRKTDKIREYGYGRKNWDTTRRARLEFAGFYCELRLPGCTGEATHVHLDAEMRGNHDLATIETTRACCLNCSSSIDGGRAHARKNAQT